MLLVILGATGDLAKKKIFPAIDAVLRKRVEACMRGAYRLHQLEKMPGTLSSSLTDINNQQKTPTEPQDSDSSGHNHSAQGAPESLGVLQESGEDLPAIIAYGRSNLTTEELIRRIDPSIEYMKETVQAIKYVRGPYESLLENLRPEIEKGKQKQKGRTDSKSPDIYIYMAVPPHVYPEIIRQVQGSEVEARVQIFAEKPQGTSLQTFRELRDMGKALTNSLLSVDHYLFKNLIRSFPGLFQARSELQPESNLSLLLRPDMLQSVRAYFRETSGVEGRLGYFNSSGTCRDVLQNHLLQVVARILSGGTCPLRVLKSIPCLDPSTCKFASYREYVGQLGEESPDSAPAETYVHARVKMTGPWMGTDLEFECGKRMPTHFVGLVIEHAPESVPVLRGYAVLPTDYEDAKTLESIGNEEVYAETRVELTPREGISTVLRLKSKDKVLKKIHHQIPRAQDSVSPYEALFQKLIFGESVNCEGFASLEQLERQWEIVDPVLDNPGVERSVYEGHRGE